MLRALVFEKTSNPNKLERKHVSHRSLDDTDLPGDTAITATSKFTVVQDSTTGDDPGVLCYKGDLEGLRDLLSKGADPNGIYQHYPLSIIALQAQSTMKIIYTLQMIRAFNGKIEIRDPQLKRTVLLESASKLMIRELDYVKNYPNLIQWLVETNLFHIHEKDVDEGCGILHFVVLTKHDKYIPSLLMKCIGLGADPRSEDFKGYNALAYIVKAKSLSTLMEIMDKVPPMRDIEVLQRAIAKTSWMSKKRSYLKRWLTLSKDCDLHRYHSI
ncbi:13635_t:CDS:2 [Ambispora gerdemannii]|uniref:13635_t:CDS:1 n=1 Tax=Ambispora gerdemannii TaxID=144530 RepID=A0A9N9CMB6_9GLOM|nr:13635_t:CDS:2 [Ambispora gerdemannii]